MAEVASAWPLTLPPQPAARPFKCCWHSLLSLVLVPPPPGAKPRATPHPPITDTFRCQFPTAVGYTYYSARSKARETGKG